MYPVFRFGKAYGSETSLGMSNLKSSSSWKATRYQSKKSGTPILKQLRKCSCECHAVIPLAKRIILLLLRTERVWTVLTVTFVFWTFTWAAHGAEIRSVLIWLMTVLPRGPLRVCKRNVQTQINFCLKSPKPQLDLDSMKICTFRIRIAFSGANRFQVSRSTGRKHSFKKPVEHSHLFRFLCMQKTRLQWVLIWSRNLDSVRNFETGHLQPKKSRKTRKCFEFSHWNTVKVEKCEASAEVKFPKTPNNYPMSSIVRNPKPPKKSTDMVRETEKLPKHKQWKFLPCSTKP